MPITSSELSQAIVVGLGYGSATVPLFDRARLVQAFGAQRVSELEPEVSALLVELGKLPVDWSVHTLDSGSAWAREQMRQRHSQLSEQALAALAWKFSYEWR